MHLWKIDFSSFGFQEGAQAEATGDAAEGLGECSSAGAMASQATQPNVSIQPLQPLHPLTSPVRTASYASWQRGVRVDGEQMLRDGEQILRWHTYTEGIVGDWLRGDGVSSRRLWQA